MFNLTTSEALRNLRLRLFAAVFATKVQRELPANRKHRINHDARLFGCWIAGITTDIANAHIFYERNYSVIAFFEIPRGGNKSFIGSRTKPRTCRFCRKQEPIVRFSDDAHAVPAMVGNRTLFLAEECNDCNHKASTVENDFGNFTHPDRTWAQVPGRKGVPKIKTFAKKSWVERTDSGMLIHQVEGDEIAQFDTSSSSKSFTVTHTLHRYRPLGVYKTLLKMALSILDAKHLGGLQQALDWIAKDGVDIGKVPDLTGFTCFTSFTSGPVPYPLPTVIVMKRRNQFAKCPALTFVLLFHNYSYQIFLPCPDDDAHLAGQHATLPMWPHPYMLQPRGIFRTRQARPISLASPDFVDAQKRSMQMGFERSVRKDVDERSKGKGKGV